MPNAIPQAIAFAALKISGFVTSAAGFAGVSGATLNAISVGTYWAATSIISVGLSVGLTAATTPKAEAAQLNLRQPDPGRVRAYGNVRLGGSFAFWEAKGNWAGDVLMIHDGEVDGFGQVWLFDDAVELEGDGDVISPGQGKYPTGFVNISLRTGLPTETVHANVAAQFDEWTASHRGDGIASIGMLCGHGKQDEFQNRYPNGEPNVSVEVFAQRVFDPRDPTQDIAAPSTWKHSRNAVLCHLHWEFFDQRAAYDDEFDIADKLIQVFNEANWNRRFAPWLSMWIEAANVADELVPLKGGGLIERYTVGAIYSEGEAPDTIRRQFLACYDGWMSQDGSGAHRIYAGKYYAPTVTLGDDDIDDYTFQRFVEDEQSVNELSLRFTDPTNGYATAEPTPWRDAADILARNGKTRSEPMELPWVQSTSQARRLAKRKMSRHLAFARGQLKTKMTDRARAALGERYIRVAISETATLADLVVEVTRAEIDLMSMSIMFDWIAADTDIDSWNAAAEEGDPPSSASRPDGVGVPVPEDVAAEPEFTSGARIKVEFTDPAREDLSFVVRWRVAGDTSYNYETFTEATDEGGGVLSVKTGFVPTDENIEVSLAFVGGSGGQGDFYEPDITVDTTEPP